VVDALQFVVPGGFTEQVLERGWRVVRRHRVGPDDLVIDV
jgi:hypothetical protein